MFVFAFEMTKKQKNIGMEKDGEKIFYHSTKLSYFCPQYF